MLLTIEDVAERFQVSVKTIKRWMKEGKIRYVRLSERCIRFRLAEMIKMEERLANGSLQPISIKSEERMLEAMISRKNASKKETVIGQALGWSIKKLKQIHKRI